MPPAVMIKIAFIIVAQDLVFARRGEIWQRFDATNDLVDLFQPPFAIFLPRVPSLQRLSC
jgi:hypothetical protein